MKHLKNKKFKIVPNAFIEIVSKSNGKPNNSGLIKEENFPINVCKNIR